MPRLRYMEWLLGRLRDAGFSADLTYHAYHVLDAHRPDPRGPREGPPSYLEGSSRLSLCRPTTIQIASTGSPPIAHSRWGEEESNEIESPGSRTYSSKPILMPSRPPST